MGTEGRLRRASQVGTNFIMRERKTSRVACPLAYGGNRFLKIVDGMDREAVNGDKESIRVRLY
jgi:hypothetical protein